MRAKVTIGVLFLVLAAFCGSCDSPFGSEKVQEEVSVDAVLWNSTLPGVVVQLAPGSATEAGRQYTVQLYEKGEARETTSVSWSQAQLNSRTKQLASFPMTSYEDQSYQYLSKKELGKVFTVEIR